MFDSHAHLDFPELASVLEEELEGARARGVEGWMVPGVRADLTTEFERLRCLPGVFFAVGIHPAWATEDSSELEQRALAHGARAIGECGLDDKTTEVPLEVQVPAFEAQLALARHLELPVILHQVGAREAFLRSLERVGLPRAGGVVHGFSGDSSWAKALVSRGLHLGVGPALLRPGRARLSEAVRSAPLERLLVETDLPSRPPGVRAATLTEVVAKLAAERGLSAEEVAQASTQAALRLFALDLGS